MVDALRRKNSARKNPVSVLLTMATVCGTLAVAALPAYAVNPVIETTARPAPGGSQTLAVSASLLRVDLARDAFTATTPEELAAQKAAAEAAAARAARTASIASSYVYRDPGPRQAGDDYPWRGSEGLSPLRYYMGECTDFVAWRLNRDAGSTGEPFRWVWSNMTPGGGSAGSWQSAWNANGWPVSGNPVAGAVAVTSGNHVAYVKEVYGDGTVLIEEYNYGNYHQYGTRVIAAGSVVAFLYPPG